jgi:hypothetical protein
MTRSSYGIRLCLLGFALALAGGCSGGGAAGTVNGTVTLDGQLLKEGTVRFVPIDGKSQTAGADVKDGKFTASVPRGEMRVEFSAPKPVGKPRKAYDTPDSPVVQEMAELIPAKYNVKSDLKLSVKSGAQDETFTLTSK